MGKPNSADEKTQEEIEQEKRELISRRYSNLQLQIQEAAGARSKYMQPIIAMPKERIMGGQPPTPEEQKVIDAAIAWMEAAEPATQSDRASCYSVVRQMLNVVGAAQGNFATHPRTGTVMDSVILRTRESTDERNPHTELPKHVRHAIGSQMINHMQ